jgi:hypothetical protein
MAALGVRDGRQRPPIAASALDRALGADEEEATAAQRTALASEVRADVRTIMLSVCNARAAAAADRQSESAATPPGIDALCAAQRAERRAADGKHGCEESISVNESVRRL